MLLKIEVDQYKFTQYKLTDFAPGSQFKLGGVKGYVIFAKVNQTNVYIVDMYGLLEILDKDLVTNYLFQWQRLFKAEQVVSIEKYLTVFTKPIELLQTK